MSIKRKLKLRTKRRKLRVKRKLSNHTRGFRVSVFRSLNHIYAQLIDDTQGKTVSSCSSLVYKDASGDKKEIAYKIGLKLAEQAREKKIESAVFDRNGKLFHGRIEALAKGLREGGLNV